MLEMIRINFISQSGAGDYLLMYGDISRGRTADFKADSIIRLLQLWFVCHPYALNLTKIKYRALQRRGDGGPRGGTSALPLLWGSWVRIFSRNYLVALYTSANRSTDRNLLVRVDTPPLPISASPCARSAAAPVVVGILIGHGRLPQASDVGVGGWWEFRCGSSAPWVAGAWLWRLDII